MTQDNSLDSKPSPAAISGRATLTMQRSRETRSWTPLTAVRVGPGFRAESGPDMTDESFIDDFFRLGSPWSRRGRRGGRPPRRSCLLGECLPTALAAAGTGPLADGRAQARSRPRLTAPPACDGVRGQRSSAVLRGRGLLSPDRPAGPGQARSV